MQKLCILIAITLLLFTQMNSVNAQCNLDDWKALKAFYESTNGDDWIDRTGWDVQIDNRDRPLENCNLSTLVGVEIPLTSNRVKSLNIPENNLKGSIPGEIENLQNLEHLILSKNRLNGSIPVAVGSLTNLKDLILDRNILIGSIPSEIGELSKLEQLFLHTNDLSGTIPPSIGNLSKLRFLGLDNNELSGGIPAELGQLNNVTGLWLQGNCLSGEIPSEIGNLNKLNSLAVSANCLHGCFPDNLSKLCTQIVGSNIDSSNIFDASWEDFCANNSGSCESVTINQNAVHTNYSGIVNIETTAANILTNNYATIYNHCVSTCDELIITEKCDRVNGFNNLSANEALWAASNAGDYIAHYFLAFHNVELAPVNIIVNYTCDLQESVFKPENNTIILGKGDTIERNSMAAMDIVTHEYAHYILHSIESLNLANYGIPGAISESFADIFGEVIEYYYGNGQNDWIFGGEVIANGSTYKGIRNLSNPKDSMMRYQLPNTYKGEHWIDTEEVCFHQDLCGIHTNCGVHNYWFYLLSNGGSGVNDNGYAYSIDSIGIEKAFNIVFENLSSHLDADIDYADVMLGSIQATKNLFGEGSNELATVIEAWRAVGMEYQEQNPIKFDMINARRVGEVIVQPNGVTDIPVQFDLTIDSLGQDLSADGLCFTLHLPEGYQGFEIVEVYPPLTIEEVDTVSVAGEMNICIDRQGTNPQKTGKAYERIASGTPILSAVHCIIVEDLDGEESEIEPIDISGYTKIGANELVSFNPSSLSFEFDNYLAEVFELAHLTIKVNHKDCNNLGSVEISTLGNLLNTFYLNDTFGNSLGSSPTIYDSRHQFYNLEMGDYEIVVFDDENHKLIKKFSIDFVADLDGSFCCPENLIISSGINNNFYSAKDAISLSMGTFITEGTLEICD